MSDTISSLATEAISYFYEAFDSSYEDLAYRSDCKLTNSYLRKFCPYPLEGAGIAFEDLPRTSYDDDWDFIQPRLSPNCPPHSRLYNNCVERLQALIRASNRQQSGRVMSQEAQQQLIEYIQAESADFDYDNQVMLASALHDDLATLTARFHNGDEMQRKLIKEVSLPICQQMYLQFIKECENGVLSEEAKEIAEGYMVTMKKAITALDQLCRAVPQVTILRN
jgi:hypothetical protein